MTRRTISFIISVSFVLVIHFQDYLYRHYWIFSGVLFFLVFIGVLLSVLVNHKRDNFSFYISLAFFIIGLSNVIVRDTELFKSEIVLRAVLADDLSGLELTLRKNNQFELLSDTYLGSGKPFRGRYKIESNKIIFLDRPYDNSFIGDTIYVFNDKIILHLDENGKPDTTSANYFKIEND